jgi:hypothetical protein
MISLEMGLGDICHPGIATKTASTSCLRRMFRTLVQFFKLGDKRFRYWRFEDAMWRVRYMK